MEAAERNAKSLKGTEAAIHKLQSHHIGPKPQPTTRTSSQTATGFRCGRTNHHPRDCKFREAECHFCHKKGHIATVCCLKSGAKCDCAPHPTHRTNFVDSTSQDPTKKVPGEILEHTFLIAGLGESSPHPFKTEVLLNGKSLIKEVYTSVSIISDELQKKYFPMLSSKKHHCNYKHTRGRKCL